MQLVALFLMLFCVAQSATAQSDSSLCDNAAQNAAATWAIPLQILLGITRVETGRKQGSALAPWPWTINLAGKGYWFDTADAAIAFAQSQLDAGNSNFDIGCFQINLSWHKAAFASLNDAFDPEQNANYAASFLSSLEKSKGNWRDATAAYHSNTPEFAQDYIAKMEPVLRTLMASPPLPEPQIVSFDPPHVNNFPLLQGEAKQGNGSLMPLVQRGTALFAEVP